MALAGSPDKAGRKYHSVQSPGGMCNFFTTEDGIHLVRTRNCCVTNVANLNAWTQGLRDCTTTNVRCPGLPTTLHIQQVVLSNVERGQKLCE